MSEPRPGQRTHRRALPMLDVTEENLSLFTITARGENWKKVGQRRFNWTVEAYVGQRKVWDRDNATYHDWYICRCVCNQRKIIPLSFIRTHKKQTCGCRIIKHDYRWMLSPIVIKQIAGINVRKVFKIEPKRVNTTKHTVPASKIPKDNLKDMMKMADDELPPGMTREDLEWQQRYLKKFESRSFQKSSTGA